MASSSVINDEYFCTKLLKKANSLEAKHDVHGVINKLLILAYQGFDKSAMGVIRCNTETKILDNCPVCYNNTELYRPYLNACDHAVCKTCWKAYISENLHLHKCSFKCIDVDCKCALIMTYEDYIYICDDYITHDLKHAVLAMLIKLYKNYVFSLNKYITCVCGTINKRDNAVILTCSSCNICLCQDCGKESHKPANCSDIRAWIIPNNDDEAYVLSNCKECPQCKINIIKDSELSCLKMTCANCEFVFCWKCLTDYTHHDINATGFYVCNIRNQTEIDPELYSEYIKYNILKKRLTPDHKCYQYLQCITNFIILYNYSKRNVAIQNLCITKYNTLKYIIIALLSDYSKYEYKIVLADRLCSFLVKDIFEYLLLNINVGPYVTLISIVDKCELTHWTCSANPHLIKLDSDLLEISYLVQDNDLYTDTYYANFLKMQVRSIIHNTDVIFDLVRTELKSWTCPSCTFFNRPTRTESQICQICMHKHKQRGVMIDAGDVGGDVGGDVWERFDDYE